MAGGGCVRLPIGWPVADCAVALCRTAAQAGSEVTARLNWVTVTVGPDDDPVEVVRAYWRAARRADRSARAEGPGLSARLIAECQAACSLAERRAQGSGAVR